MQPTQAASIPPLRRTCWLVHLTGASQKKLTSDRWTAQGSRQLGEAGRKVGPAKPIAAGCCWKASWYAASHPGSGLMSSSAAAVAAPQQDHLAGCKVSADPSPWPRASRAGERIV